MTDLPQTIAEAGEWLRNGRITSETLTGALLERCHATSETISAFITICDESALAAARQADQELASGQDRGPLHGIPIGIKDIIATKDAPTTANSRVMDLKWGAGWDATVTAKLREAGAVNLGKLGLMEYAIGWPDPATGFPIPKNPWNPAYSPGGSSSGTGTAVAGGLILGGLGTDTGGSIRMPSAWCGISGIKPTFGRVSKYGCVPLGYSLDNIGPMARTVYDCALMLDVLAGYDPHDPCSADKPVPAMTAMLDGSLEGVRIGLIKPFFDYEYLDPETKDAVLGAASQMGAAGALVKEVDIPHALASNAALWATMVPEAYTYHEPDLQTKFELYGKYTLEILRQGAFYTASDYIQAQRVRELLREECYTALADFDVLIMPTTAFAPPINQGFEIFEAFKRVNYTGLWNLTGFPALSVNSGFNREGLPLGLQIIGKPLDEPMVLKVGDAYQRLTDWHLQIPEMAKGASLV
jgi:aspartyl-tRNA(Asn)/glutamyl-tRNA(Gln) amidotransferase subunit A